MVNLIDKLLDASVVGGFSRLGYAVRSRTGDWEPLRPGVLDGSTVAITGPTSGLGLAASVALRRLGASLVLIGRDAGRLDRTAESLRARQGVGGTITELVADLGDLEAVAAVGRRMVAEGIGLRALVHNAGALDRERAESPQGFERTVATHVLGPHLLTRIVASRTARAITVSSGGMYAAPLPDLSRGGSLEMKIGRWDGTKQYAIAKRAQVTLNELWPNVEPGTVFAAMHPGWADTPGVRTSIPLFAKVTGPVLRTAEEGADTVVWLAATDRETSTGRFWCDREERPTHRLPNTRRADSQAARSALWEWCDSVTAPYVS